MILRNTVSGQQIRQDSINWLPIYYVVACVWFAMYCQSFPTKANRYEGNIPDNTFFKHLNNKRT
jgi:hypothetical protein